ncbi:Protein of unknown function [Micrococcales bacterium KH10]|nr:Protein of unknown function [Micrococcales bacterium KH10]
MSEPGWYRDPSGQLRWWDGQRWGNAIPWAVGATQPAFATAAPDRGNQRRPVLKVVIIALAVLVGIAVTGIVATGFVRAGTDSPRSVTQRFVDEFLTAEECTDRVIKIGNEDTTETFRGGQLMDCDQLSFAPNPPGFAMTVESVTQSGGNKATATVRVSTAYLEDNGEYRIYLRQIDGRWLINSVQQMSRGADVL